MAFTATNTPPNLTLSTVDNNRRPGLTSMYLPSGTDETNALGFLNLIRDEYLALTQNRLIRASVAYGFREDAPLAVIPKSSESERKLVLIFDVDNGRGTVEQEIPSVVFEVEADNTDEVDPAQPLVAAYANLIIQGAVGPANGVVNQYGLQITGIRRAFVRHNKTGRRR